MTHTPISTMPSRLSTGDVALFSFFAAFFAVVIAHG